MKLFYRVSIYALCLILTIVAIIPIQAPSTYYAGYYYAGREINAPWGVYANIFTIDPVIPLLFGGGLVGYSGAFI
jgi:hypothetical protein